MQRGLAAGAGPQQQQWDTAESKPRQELGKLGGAGRPVGQSLAQHTACMALLKVTDLGGVAGGGVVTGAGGGVRLAWGAVLLRQLYYSSRASPE